MGKIFKPLMILTLTILKGSVLYSQEQENMIDLLTRKFKDYIEAVPREEIYIHTDREEYIGGEELWFNIYLINRQNFKTSSGSRIAYFELLNYENRPVIQKRILLNKGFGPGQVKLPDTLSSGTYTIRAYTNWMKNFLPYNCFTKDIKIFNAFNNKTFKGKFSSETHITGKIPDPDFFPDTVSGIILKLMKMKKDELDIKIIADEKYTAGNGNLVYLFIQTHGIIDHISSGMITGDSGLILPVGSLTPGVNQITAFNSKGRPVCERFNYTPAKDIPIISISSADSFKSREKVILDLAAENGLKEVLDSGNLSVSVVPVTNNRPLTSLKDFLIFGTEFGLNVSGFSSSGSIRYASPEVIDSILENVRSNWINWTEILAGSIPQFKFRAETEEHFLQGKLNAAEPPASQSSEIVLLSIPGRYPEFQYAKTDNEGNFIFSIHIDEDFKDLVIMPDDLGKKQKIILESSFSDKFFNSEIKVDSSGASVPQYIAEWSANYQVRKIYGVNSTGNPLDPLFSPLKPVRFYGKPDIELIMADYVSLPEMEEVFFELLPNVSMRKRNSAYVISITDRINEIRYELTPALLLDGVKIKDPSIIADLDPITVERIDVVKEKYLAGSYSFPGIVNVITKSADFSSIQLPDFMIRLPYKVADPVLSFVSPDYSSTEAKNSTIPDFRNTIYWNPSLKPGKEGWIRAEFWTSDVVSDYEINIQGITSEGKIISTRRLFRIE